jgi:hypothetical protein
MAVATSPVAHGNDAERLARAIPPAMRAIVDHEGLDRPAASSSEMGRFETEWLSSEANLVALADLSQNAQTQLRPPERQGCSVLRLG